MTEEKKPVKPAEQTPAQQPADAAKAAPAPAAHKGPRKKGRAPAFGLVHINCSFNNTVITITDDRGNAITWATSGGCGFRGTKKGTPFAAQITAAKAVGKAVELGMREAAVLVCGPGPGRETAVRAVQSSGLHVISIKDVTPIPHNGCRPPKARRV
ncbi:MAG: 30S ribosomal protein S11 [Elusimicrobiales bacterium]